MTPRADAAARALLKQTLHLKALYADLSVVPFGRCRARDKLFALAEAFDEALAQPITEVIKPYAPWNGITR